MSLVTVDEMAARIEAGELDDPREGGARRVVVTKASTIQMKPVHWLWRKRMPLGELTLLAGREGIGKSTVAFQLAAWITRGEMKGDFQGTPRSVIIAATEDSWEHTIVPRLIGAGADLDRVLRVEVETSKGLHGTLTLPSDLGELERVVNENDVALLLLDPLMSRLSTNLDSHKDAEVRVALEPLTDFAKRTNVAVLGLIHVNKGKDTDALNLIMGSRAFPAVARAVLVAMKDPEQPNQFILGLEKSNLGSVADLPAFAYRITDKEVGQSAEGETISTGVVEWLGDSAKTIREAMETTAAIANGDDAPALTEAAEWLEDYLRAARTDDAKQSMAIKKAAHAVGISASSLARARQRLGVTTRSFGFPRTSVWELPEQAAVPF